jgi:hypothetical protein
MVIEEQEIGMTVLDQINSYLAGQPERKRSDMRQVHDCILRISPKCELWFLDGRNSEGKIVSNPNIGYGRQSIELAGGKAKDFYRIGISANTTGISIYLMGIDDKTFLARTYGDRIGKASVTGYCIKFRSLKDIDAQVLEEIVHFALGNRAAV